MWMTAGCYDSGAAGGRSPRWNMGSETRNETGLPRIGLNRIARAKSRRWRYGEDRRNEGEFKPTRLIPAPTASSGRVTKGK